MSLTSINFSLDKQAPSNKQTNKQTTLWQPTSFTSHKYSAPTCQVQG